MRMSRLPGIVMLSAMAVASSAAAQTVVPVGPFRSIELHDGGNVIVRHGSPQRVTLLTGDLQYTSVRVADGQRLVIERCRRKCPRGYQMQVEVITPELPAAGVSNGGTLQSVGAFPIRTAIEADVEQGGTLDIRSIAADSVDAAVHSGGRIFTTPRETLSATVVSGGVITYFGDVRVKRSVRDGGMVARGTASDADLPLSELCPSPHPIAPIAPLPPTPPSLSRRKRG